jgi:lycopene cyclase domain-containing protein
MQQNDSPCCLSQRNTTGQVIVQSHQKPYYWPPRGCNPGSSIGSIDPNGSSTNGGNIYGTDWYLGAAVYADVMVRPMQRFTPTPVSDSFNRSISYQHLLTLPAMNILLPIMVPTSVLVFMDTIHLQRGTWVINEGTKLGIQPWKHMDIEELVFFIATNTMIVMGLVAFDYGLALPTAFPSRYPTFTGRTPFLKLMKPGFRAFFTAKFPVDEYHHIAESISILKKKSRSFHTASAVFEGRLRLDLILL